MYISENVAPTAELSTGLALQVHRVPQTRITFSGAREVLCTCGTPSVAPMNLAALVPAHNAVLTCNSVLDDDLLDVIHRLRPTMKSIRLEVHLSTATLPRIRQKIQALPADVSLILIVDKMDAWQVTALEFLDARIAEYRVIPSKAYPIELFLREMPAFTQSKMTWSFLPGQSGLSPFFSVDELHGTLGQITRWPASYKRLTRLTLSPTQYYKSIATVARPISNESVWLSSGPELSEQQRALLWDFTQDLQAGDIVDFSDAASLALRQRIARNRFNSGKEFYFLDQCLVSRHLWEDFRQSPFAELYDHFSWNEFLATRPVRVTRASLALPAPAVSMDQFVAQCRARYARHPGSAFYKDFFSFFEDGIEWRSRGVRGLAKIKQWMTLAPYRKLQRWVRIAGEHIADYRFEVTETQHIAKKILFRAANRFYWSLHRLYWMGYKAAWMATEVFWFIYELGWVFRELLWRVADFFWLVYKYILSPVIGFARTLVDQPREWNDKPWLERLQLRTGHVARKFGWLFLKAVRLR